MEFKSLSISKKTVLISAALITGILLILISSFPLNNKKAVQKTRLEIYVEETENRLCETISKINGTGSTKVFITTENTFETVYASNACVDETPSGKTTEKSLAYAGSSSYSTEPVIIKELCPDIKGVLIVCEGGSDKNVKAEIIKSVSTALGISQNKIYVTGGTDK